MHQSIATTDHLYSIRPNLPPAPLTKSIHVGRGVLQRHSGIVARRRRAGRITRSLSKQDDRSPSEVGGQSVRRDERDPVSVRMVGMLVGESGMRSAERFRATARDRRKLNKRRKAELIRMKFAVVASLLLATWTSLHADCPTPSDRAIGGRITTIGQAADTLQVTTATYIDFTRPSPMSTAG